MFIQERKVIIIGIISLIVTVVTFGYLQSTGLIETSKYKFGGAIAGFLAIAYILHLIYGKQPNQGKSVKKPKKAKKAKISITPKDPEGEVVIFKQQNEAKLIEEKKGITGLIDDFFIRYASNAKYIEEYGLDLSKILHCLADELDGKECEDINDLCSALETNTGEMKRLRKDYRLTKAKEIRDDLRSTEKDTRRNINDFRHGNIFKRLKDSHRLLKRCNFQGCSVYFL